MATDVPTEGASAEMSTERLANEEQIQNRRHTIASVRPSVGTIIEDSLPSHASSSSAPNSELLWTRYNRRISSLVTRNKLPLVSIMMKLL